MVASTTDRVCADRVGGGRLSVLRRYGDHAGDKKDRDSERCFHKILAGRKCAFDLCNRDWLPRLMIYFHREAIRNLVGVGFKSPQLSKRDILVKTRHLAGC